MIFSILYVMIITYSIERSDTMALDYNNKVEIPSHTVRVPNGDKVYIQYTVEAYRNKKGQPTSKRVSIGKLDPESGLMIPNNRYYELFNQQPKIVSQPSMVRSVGSYGVFRGVSTSLGLDKIVKKVFKERAEAIMSIAHYMFCEGNVMYYLNDWQEEHITFSKELLNTAGISKLFSGITRTDRLSFFNAWMKAKRTEEYLAYDVTSISSYGKGIESLEWGYNRDKEKLPQINLGMYYGEESRLPLYYRIYPGSIPDKAHLRYMVEDNDVISCKKARFVMDRGFYSQENIAYLIKKGCRFIIALPGHMKFCQELIEKHREEIVNHSECYLGSGKPYGKAYTVDVDEYRMKVHLYYDPYKAVRDSSNLYEEIARQEAALGEMKTAPEKNKHYIALKETGESIYWLTLLSRTGLFNYDYSSLLSLAEEIKRMLIASLNTAKNKNV